MAIIKRNIQSFAKKNTNLEFTGFVLFMLGAPSEGFARRSSQKCFAHERSQCSHSRIRGDDNKKIRTVWFVFFSYGAPLPTQVEPRV